MTSLAPRCARTCGCRAPRQATGKGPMARVRLAPLFVPVEWELVRMTVGRTKLGALEVSSIALGCMSMTPIYGMPDPEEAVATLHQAPDLGIDFIDTSDAYGAN